MVSSLWLELLTGEKPFKTAPLCRVCSAAPATVPQTSSNSSSQQPPRHQQPTQPSCTSSRTRPEATSSTTSLPSRGFHQKPLNCLIPPQKVQKVSGFCFGLRGAYEAYQNNEIDLAVLGFQSNIISCYLFLCPCVYLFVLYCSLNPPWRGPDIIQQLKKKTCEKRVRGQKRIVSQIFFLFK